MAVRVESSPFSRHGKTFDDEQHALFRRLAEANTKRRQQLLHWSEHPDSSNKELPFSKVADLPPSNKRAVDDGEESQSRVSTIRPDTSVAQESHRSIRSFSTVAKSAMDDKTEFGRPRTVYAESAAPGSISSVRVPNVPRAAETEDEFDCPFCGQALDSAHMKVRQQWKRHVFRDLRPYLCTFATCQTAEKLYATRHEWIYHEMQVHRRKWVCEAPCGLEFRSRSAMAKHIPHCHQGSLTDTQLRIMLDMSERPVDDLVPACCPLCPAEPMSLRQLHAHTSQHLEELSLFVIHNAQQNSDEDDVSLASNLAVQAEAPRDAAAQSSSQPLSSSTPSQASLEDSTAIKSVPQKTRDQSVEDFKALSGASQLDSFIKTTQWISEASRFPPAVVKSHSPVITTAEHVLPVRDLEADEEYVIQAFERHAKNCSQCNDPLQVLEEGDTRTLCDRGHEYANDVAEYLYSKNGKAYSVIDRDYNNPTLVKIPRNCIASRGLLLAVEHGLRLGRTEAPRATSGRDFIPTYESQTRSAKPRRVIVCPSPRSSGVRGSLYDSDAADRVKRVGESSRIYKRREE
ncbi:hypothetical protein BDV59DRAFT_184198 [Aspergillus ambiguus]|uniref:uncharacterized protein n=1 Tax=Aspergillus ambiguus TaxID=176160 RepID=UPI003CCDE542